MKIWLLENGERTGPYETFAVRDRLSAGELNAETPAWYEDAPGWVTLADVPSLTGLFASESAEAEMQAEADAVLGGADGLQVLYELPPLHPVQRFFARFFDLTIYMNLLWLIRAQSGDNPFVPIQDPLMAVGYYLPYVIIDALMMHYLGTTPGKKLLGVRVISSTGMLDLGESLVRSMRVWVLGFGMFLIMPISLAISWFMGRRLGRFLWDVPKQYLVTVEPLTPAKVWLYIGVVVSMAFILSAAMPEEMMPDTLGQMLEMMRPKK